MRVWSGSRWATTVLASVIPSRWGFHTAREKNWWARSCGQRPARFAAVSIPVTVRRPTAVAMPTARWQNTRKDGAVKQGRTIWKTRRIDAGIVGNGKHRRPLNEVDSDPSMLP